MVGFNLWLTKQRVDLFQPSQTLPNQLKVHDIRALIEGVSAIDGSLGQVKTTCPFSCKLFRNHIEFMCGCVEITKHATFHEFKKLVAVYD